MSSSYIRDMLEEEPDITTSTREVANFYAHRNVLLTGGSGFLGKLLSEKILRTCSNIKTLFLLLRGKKGKTPQERFNELFDDPVFSRLHKERPEFAKKVVLIEGDMVEVGMGLSSEHRKLLRSTHIVIHGAATVRFDEKLRTAVNINVRGTKELLSLAREMNDLKAFVHISTAYSNCVSNVIDEKFYPPPLNSDKILNLLDILDDAALDHLTPQLLGKWPNTYAFTKAIAEDIIYRNCQSLPVCIVRPSIVMATSKEPVAGWINNVYGATGIVVGAAVGLLRTLHCDANLVADMIPADYVVNNIIVAAWDIAKARSQRVNGLDSSMTPKFEEPPIYNAVSSNQSPTTWGDLMRYTEEFGIPVGSNLCIWYYCFRLNKYRWVHNISVIFLHLIPAIIVDSFARLTGRKPQLWNAYKKIHKFSSVIEYFTLQEWQFSNDNYQRLWKSLGPADRSDFDLDLEQLDWREYSYHHVRGLRVYLLKDPMETLPQGQARYAKLKIAHYTLLTAMYGFLLWLLWRALQFIVQCAVSRLGLSPGFQSESQADPNRRTGYGVSGLS